MMELSQLMEVLELSMTIKTKRNRSWIYSSLMRLHFTQSVQMELSEDGYCSEWVNRIIKSNLLIKSVIFNFL